MAEETKKISFGFTKLKKPNILVKPVEISKPERDYVDSFDGAKGKFSYKGNVRCDEPVRKELVIPLIGTRTAFDVIRSKVEESKLEQKTNEDNSEKGKVKDGNATNGTAEPVGKEVVKQNDKSNDDKTQLSIDDLAAKEIINDLHNAVEEKASNAIIIKQPNKINKAGDEKDAPIDYENIPVNDFGLAMLRGMGWTPETGIGKEQKVVQVVAPKLRPKGLGLGADKVVLQQANKDPDLTIYIKSYVKFLNGLHKGKYGQVESMDEDNGRVIVKLALGGSVSVSEMLLMAVTKKDYEKNSKVLNPAAYESFKEPDRPSEGKGKSDLEKSLSESRRKSHDNNRHRKETYDRRESKDRNRRSEKEEDSDSDSDTGKTAGRSSSSSSERKTDRKKKKEARDNSSDRRHKKSKKKRKKRRKNSSEGESDSSSDKKRERERSKNHSHHSKSKKSCHR